MGLPAIDLDILVAVVLGLLMASCVGIMCLMRDREWAPPQLLPRTLRCEAKGRRAQVDFIERVEAGLRMRSVQHCSIRGGTERCREQCRDLPAERLRETFESLA
jgi:hypothetical protein